ncbi:hypothetical protein PG987_005894 [Apiospora arundinis]
MEKTKVTLGIDLGSTSTRAVLGRHYVEEIKHKTPSVRFSPGDFSSSIYPFEPRGPVYLYEDDDPTRRPVSAKYAFYALVDASDELLEQYRLVEELIAGRGDIHFKKRLRKGLEELFTRIANLSHAICDEYDYEIGIIGLSVPSQWTLDFEDLYREIIVTTFGDCYRERMVFVYETEALGHFLCRDYMRKLLQPSDRSNQDGKTVRHEVLLFIDFGGHNANSCTFNIVYDENDQPSFYQISAPRGAGGGSEQWEYNVSQAAVRMLERERGQRLCSSAKREIYDDFNKKKCSLGPSFGRKVYLFRGFDENDQPLAVRIGPQSIEEHFDAAMERPLELARQRIEELSAIKDSKPRVIVSGGTSRHDGLKDKLRQMCEENEIEPPLFTDMWSIKCDSMKIAQGTAYAASNRITVEEFFRRGAAIGVQRQQHAARCENNPQGLWDNEAVFALSKERCVVWYSSLTGKDHLRLVCHPFYERERPPKNLAFYRCYDLLNLGMPTKGKWRIALSLTISEGEVILVMERHYTHWTDGSQPVHFNTVKLPLYYNGGENCIHVGRENEDNHEILDSVTQGYRSEKFEAKKQRREQRLAQHKDSGLGLRSTRSRGAGGLQIGATQVEEVSDINSSVGSQRETATPALFDDPVEQYVRQTLAETLSQEEEVDSVFRRANPAPGDTVDTLFASVSSAPPPPAFVDMRDVDLMTTASSSMGYFDQHVHGETPKPCSHEPNMPSSTSVSSYGSRASPYRRRGKLTPRPLKADPRTPQQSATRRTKRRSWSDVSPISPY